MNNLCENIVREALISSIGLPSGKLQLQIKGDSTMRETAMFRPKVNTVIDENFDKFIKKVNKVLTQTGVHQMTICFHNSEIVTRRIFDPYAYTAHDAKSFLQDGYTDRQFPMMDYEDKLDVMQEVYKFLSESKRVTKTLPDEWRVILQENNDNWEPITKDEISRILSVLQPLRNIEHYYVRRVDISINQNLVELQFNCDGTHIMQPSILTQFIEEIV